MRHKGWTLLFAAASALALWAVFGAATASPYTIDTPYDYPVKPGTPEWLQYANVLGRRRACEVPEEILTHMTTEALLQTVLDYPFLGDMYAFNTMEMGYETVKRRFRGLQELESRADCLEVLGRRCEEIALLTEEEQTLENNMAMQMYGIILEKAAGPEAE
ncbi:MAG: hypothetical protein HFF53_00140 [Lawsonibacter sp.]|nr:hypothetical protein [Lawsonibacter sp.]